MSEGDVKCSMVNLIMSSHKYERERKIDRKCKQQHIDDAMWNKKKKKKNSL